MGRITPRRLWVAATVTVLSLLLTGALARADTTDTTTDTLSLGYLDPGTGLTVMPGGTLVGSEVIYDGGDVIVSAGASFDSCLGGYVCLYSEVNFGGQMLEFTSWTAWHDLADYGFNNVTSGWRNRKSVDAQLATGTGGAGSRLCLNNNDSDGYIPNFDDSASSARIRDGSGYC